MVGKVCSLRTETPANTSSIGLILVSWRCYYSSDSNFELVLNFSILILTFSLSFLFLYSFYFSFKISYFRTYIYLCVRVYFTLLFSHLADAFIQSDLQIRKSNSNYKLKVSKYYKYTFKKIKKLNKMTNAYNNI